jgi:hypothetical protein
MPAKLENLSRFYAYKTRAEGEKCRAAIKKVKRGAVTERKLQRKMDVQKRREERFQAKVKDAKEEYNRLKRNKKRVAKEIEKDRETVIKCDELKTSWRPEFISKRAAVGLGPYSGFRENRGQTPVPESSPPAPANPPQRRPRRRRDVSESNIIYESSSRRLRSRGQQY